MCEERNATAKRRSSSRLARIQHSRLRARIANIQPPAIARENARPQNQAPLTGGACPDQPPLSPTPGVHMPNFVYQHAQQENDPEIQAAVAASHEEWYRYRTAYQTKRDNLMEIAMRTVMLMRQNRQLQQKLAALQAETKVFMDSVANHPPPPKGMPPRNMCISVQNQGPNQQSIRVNLQYPREMNPQNQRRNIPILSPPISPNDRQDIPYELLEIINESRFCEQEKSVLVEQNKVMEAALPQVNVKTEE